MENFLIFSGALAVFVGFLAVIEGHLGWFGHLRRRKSLSWTPRRVQWSTSALKIVRVLWR